MESLARWPLRCLCSARASRWGQQRDRDPHRACASLRRDHPDRPYVQI